MESINLVLIDDDSVIRQVLKSLLYKRLGRKSLNIYSCSDGIDGLGHLYVVHPEVIIIDTTLPKYGGLEIIDYVVSNTTLNDSSLKVVVVSTDGEVPIDNLPPGYVLFNKNDPDFLEKVVSEVVAIVSGSENSSNNEKPTFTEKVARSVHKYANRSDIASIKAHNAPTLFKRLIYKISWLLLQLVTSVFLALLYILIGRKDEDLNLPQRRKDLSASRIRSYPTIAVGLALLILIAIQAVLVAIALIGFINAARQDSSAALNPLLTISSPAALGIITDDSVLIEGEVEPESADITSVEYQMDGTDGSWDICKFEGTGEFTATQADPDFVSGTGGGEAGSTVRAIVETPDGKLIIAGDFANYNGTGINRVARLNSDGSLDTSFDVGSGANNLVYSAATQSDGKVIIGGIFSAYNGSNISYLARLNTDGSLDTGFNIGTGPTNSVDTIAVQPDGKIVIGGAFTSFNGTSINRITRLNSDGTLDAGFNVGTGAGSIVNSIAIQPDGKILIGGSFTSYNGTSINRIARLDSDGTLDASFTVGTGAGGTVNAVSIQSDDKILISGSFTSYAGTSRNRIARLNSNGTLDTGFVIGTGPNNIVNSVVSQPDGKVLVAGTFTTYNGAAINRIARLNSNGSFDSDFNTGAGANNSIYRVVVLSTGKIILSGSFNSYNSIKVGFIIRLNSDASADADFNFSTGANRQVDSIVVQPDGKILIGGQFNRYDGVYINRIARLNSDGVLDSGFVPGSGANDNISSIALQSDGKIVIGGNFTNYDGTTVNRIARLNSDGSIDSGFNVGSGANNLVYAVAVQPDGKILVVGAFSQYNGVNSAGIVRLNSDGSIDSGFNVGTGAVGTVLSVAIQSDGKILIGGLFSSYNGTARNRIARLDSDGSIDTGFNIGTGANNSVHSIAVEPGGKILIGGLFTTYNGASATRLARLNSDGSNDTSFPNSGALNGPNSTVYVILPQSDGTIIIGGDFSSYSTTPRQGIARINSNSTLNNQINALLSSGSSVRAVAVQSDGKILLGTTGRKIDGFFYFGRLLSASEYSSFECPIPTTNLSQGPHTAYFRSTDSLGYSSTTQSVTFTYDSLPPDGSVLINNDGQYTTSNTVTLSLPATDSGTSVQDMMISQDPSFTSASWVGYQASTSYELSSGDGMKTVYAKYRDQAGHESTAYSDSILVDTVGPSGSLNLTDDPSSDAFADILVLPQATDAGSGVAQMTIVTGEQFSQGEWRLYSEIVRLTLPAAGLNTVHVKFADAAGNESEVYSETINVLSVISNQPPPTAGEEQPEEELPEEELSDDEFPEEETPTSPPVVIPPAIPIPPAPQVPSLFGRLATAATAIVEGVTEVAEDVVVVWEEKSYGTATSTTVTAFSLGYLLLFANELPALGLRLWVAALGILKAKSVGVPFGVAYDAVDKSPLNNVIVRVYDENGKMVDTDVTRYNGAFKLNIPAGSYRLDASKSGYRFPSKTISATADGIYQDIYLGGVFQFSERNSIDKAMPMDRVDAGLFRSLNAVAQSKAINVAFLLLRIMLVVGAVISAIVLVYNPTVVNLAVLATYLIPSTILLIQKMFSVSSAYGEVRMEDGSLASGVEVLLLEYDTDKVLQRSITDENGKYRIVTYPGRFKIQLDDRHMLIEGKDEIVTSKKLQIVAEKLKVRAIGANDPML